MKGGCDIQRTGRGDIPVQAAETSSPTTVGRDDGGQMTEHRVYVIELDDAIGPRLRNDRPNVYVGTTARDVDEEFARIQSGDSGHDEAVQDNALRVLWETFEHFDPTSAEDVHRQREKLVCKLTRRGYHVHGYPPRYLYVIKLDDSKGSRNVEGDWVYVGESSREPQERLQQHLDGYRDDDGNPRFSRTVNRYGVDLVPELFRHEQPACMYCAKRREQELAEKLRSDGYTVTSG